VAACLSRRDESVASSVKQFDLAIVGAGILGLAHALAASRLGLRVVVIERDTRANGASIRNFGFVTVSGQERGTIWRRTLRSRDVWLEVANAAGIDVLQHGAMIAARRPEALAVIEAFMQTEMAEGCELLSPAELGSRQAALDPQHFAGALWSPHELRVESKTAIPRLAAWLEEHHGVALHRGTAVHSAVPPVVETSRGPIHAGKVVVCPGDDLATLFPDRIAARGVNRCKLHMLRLADPGFRLSSAVLSDLSLARYAGFAALPPAAALGQRLEAEEKPALDNGVHLIVVQSADGSLVVGDSHHYLPTPEPFNDESVDDIILGAYHHVFRGTHPKVIARWTGTYATADQPMLIDAPAPDVRLVINTGGNGASTSFAVAEEVIADLFEKEIESIRRSA
jgi:FAD dependent oxidoreductase TIGR03364